MSEFPKIDKGIAAIYFAEGFLTERERSDRARFREIAQLFHESRELLFPNPGGLDGIDDERLRTEFADETAQEFCSEGAKADDKWRKIWKGLIAAGRDSFQE